MGHTPKIFGMGFKILWGTSVQSTRCRHTEVSDQGKIGVGLWPTRSKFSKSSAYLRCVVYAECTMGHGYLWNYIIIIEGLVTHQAEAYPSFHSIKQLGVYTCQHF